VHRIEEQMTLLGYTGADHKQKYLTDRFDHVFFFGDLNYRVATTREYADKQIELARWDVLLYKDELLHSRSQGIVFPRFQEGRICFPPTYKYDIDSHNFDTKKLRVPSWTDRILYKSRKKYFPFFGNRNEVVCESYGSYRDVICSDHRPGICF
jgi:phosphatidylinositol-bisphosphatase